MSTPTIFTSGLEGKSDLIATYEPAAPFEVVIESSVQKLFGRHIRERAEQTLQEFKVNKGRLVIKDDGALDFIIAARIEAVLRKAGAAKAPPFKPIDRTPAEKDRLRRSRLYLPGNQPDLMLNAGLFGADSLILDLEDSVAPDQKVDARILVRRILGEAHRLFPATELIVRVNPLSGPFGYEDLREIVPALPHLLLLPKCDTDHDIKEADREVTAIEREFGLQGRILFMPLIETVKGVVNALAIAQASGRNVALCFGAEDFTRDLGVPRTREGKETLAARSQIVYAAKVAGIQAIDTVFADVGDDQGLLASSLEAKSLGFVGKGVIHPRQIPIVHQAFAPTAAEIEEARKIVEAMQRAVETGAGVVSLGTKMVDAPVAERARKVIALAKQLGLPGVEGL